MSDSVAGITLLDGEELIHDLRPRWSRWFWPIILTAGFYLPFAWQKRRRTRYLVTTDRVIVKRGGWMGSSTDEYQINQIKRVQTSRSLGEKILGGGTLLLDLGADELKLDSLPMFQTVKTSIQNAQRSD